VEPGQRPGPGAADNSRAGRDLRLHRAQVLQLRPALGGTPVWPLPGPADHRHDACPVTAKGTRSSLVSLLYGEWLRREHRRGDAREQLRVAYALLSDMGMEAFAERARRELLATGETVRRRSVETLDELTPQEGPGCAPGCRRADEPGDRGPAVPQSAHGGVAPEQGVRKARSAPARSSARRCPTSAPGSSASSSHRGPGPRGQTKEGDQRDCEPSGGTLRSSRSEPNQMLIPTLTSHRRNPRPDSRRRTGAGQPVTWANSRVIGP
jgi:hypothetical protein